MKTSLSVTSSMDRASVLYLKSHRHTKAASVFSYVAFQEFSSVVFHIQVCGPFRANRVKGVRSVYRFVSSHADVRLSQHHPSKRPSLLRCVAFAVYVFISADSLFRSMGRSVCSFPSATLSGPLCFLVSAGVGQSESSNSALLFQPCVDSSGSFAFHTIFRISLLIFTKELPGISIGIAPNLFIEFGRTDILTILRFPLHEHGISLSLFKSS